MGHRLIHAKRVVPPPAVAYDSSLRLPDKDAKDVRDFAKAHPFEHTAKAVFFLANVMEVSCGIEIW